MSAQKIEQEIKIKCNKCGLISEEFKTSQYVPVVMGQCWTLPDKCKGMVDGQKCDSWDNTVIFVR